MPRLTAKGALLHKCQLIPDPDKFESKIPPSASCCQKIVEKWRHLAIVSTKNPRTGDYFKSRASIFKERKRHAQYAFTVHPFSRLAKYREIFMHSVWSTLLIIDPFQATFMATENEMMRRFWLNTALGVYQRVMSFALIGDIIVNFLLGYEISQTHEIVLEPKRIARRYVATYFFFDVIAVLTAWVRYNLTALNHAVVVSLRQLFVLRLVRLGSLSEHFVFILRLLDVPEGVAQCINIFVSNLCIVHWLTCALAWWPLMEYVFKLENQGASWTVEAKVALKDDVSLVFRYWRFLLKTMFHFYGASGGPYDSKNTGEYVIFALTVMVGIGYYTYAIAVVGQLFTMAHISETMYKELVAQVNQYSSSKKFSSDLKSRLLLYYETKFQRRFFNEHVILYSMSQHLRLEVVLFSFKHLIENGIIFKNISKAAVGTVVGQLRQDIYLPGDVVTGTYCPSERMHFLSHGTMAVFMNLKDATSQQDVNREFEIMHLEDGDVLGYSAGLLLDVYTFRAVVLERTEIYSMLKTKFEQIRIKYPEMGKRVDELRVRRHAYVSKMIQAREFSTHEDILEELCDGKILLVGRKR